MIDAQKLREWQEQIRTEDKRQFRLTLFIGLIIVPLVVAIIQVAASFIVYWINR